jgi:hypothetical protein
MQELKVLRTVLETAALGWGYLCKLVDVSVDDARRLTLCCRRRRAAGSSILEVLILLQMAVKEAIFKT